MAATIIGAAAVAVWLYLIAFRGEFWRVPDGALAVGPLSRRSVVAVIPARDEADVIGRAVASLLGQDYRGELHIVVVDDRSSDGTAAAARAAAAAAGGDDRLTVATAEQLPPGWTGKLWAVKQGIDAAQTRPQPADYLLLTDADVVYAPAVLRALVARAETGHLALTSLMVKLRCKSFAERSLIPAFIFFFQMLYPFPLVNRTDRATAAAAGGCMLIRTEILRQAGGIEAIRGALIDDCTLAKLIKARGPIWLGLTDRVRSIRRYPRVGDIRQMVARSAYAQLRYSPLLLAGTVAGMALTYLVPPLMALFASGSARVMGLWAWCVMAVVFQPTLRLYRLSPLWGLALPVIALCYMLFTLDSALQFARGRGGLWKGRIQAGAP